MSNISSRDRGEIWVEGEELHFIDGDGVEWKYTGDSVISDRFDGEGKEGQIWIDGDKIHYIDENDTDRILPSEVSDEVSDTSIDPGLPGTVWIEDSKITYIGRNDDFDGIVASAYQEKEYTDQEHDNRFDNIAAHDDERRLHSDDHTNRPRHADSYTVHTDTRRSGYQTSLHVDYEEEKYIDQHTDSGHSNYYTKHTDIDGHEDHANSPHKDVTHQEGQPEKV